VKAVINALTLALASDEDYAHLGIGVAKSFAEAFVKENAELFADPGPAVRAQAIVRRAGPQPADPNDLAESFAGLSDLERAVVHHVPVVGPDGLTAKQRAAVGGVGLCANCQQPNNNHLPGCAKASGEDKRAVTKDPLPPAV